MKCFHIQTFVHIFQVNCQAVLLSFIHFFTHSSHMRLTECKEFEHMNIRFLLFDPTVPTYSTMSKVGLKLIRYQGSGFLRLLIDLKKCGQSYKFPNSRLIKWGQAEFFIVWITLDIMDGLHDYLLQSGLHLHSISLSILSL